jgi:Cu+-exporting ATPase
VLDPVCGHDVDPRRQSTALTTTARPIISALPAAAPKFATDPAKYLDKAAAPPAALPEGTIYTCPMHPQIRQVGPGSCPICGMALEPEWRASMTGRTPNLPT